MVKKEKFKYNNSIPGYMAGDKDQRDYVQEITNLLDRTGTRTKDIESLPFDHLMRNTQDILEDGKLEDVLSAIKDLQSTDTIQVGLKGFLQTVSHYDYYPSQENLEAMFENAVYLKNITEHEIYIDSKYSEHYSFDSREEFEANAYGYACMTLCTLLLHKHGKKAESIKLQVDEELGTPEVEVYKEMAFDAREYLDRKGQGILKPEMEKWMERHYEVFDDVQFIGD